VIVGRVLSAVLHHGGMTRRVAPWVPGVLDAAAVSNLLLGGALVALPSDRLGGVPVGAARAAGGAVMAFGLAYSAVAADPRGWRRLLVVGAAGKAVGAATGLVQSLARGRRDPLTLVSLVDAFWLPLFVAAAVDTGVRGRRGR
jgi:hypothetical protein